MKRSRRRPRAGDLVRVTWQDIEHDSHGWTPAAELASSTSTPYLAAGWIVKLGRRWLVLAPMTHERDAFCSYRIPRGAIRSIDRLRPA